MSEYPSDWEITNLGNLATIKASNVDKKTKQGQKEISLCNYMDVFKNPVVSSTLAFMRSTASEKEISEFSLFKGDVLLTKDSEVPEEIGIPSVVTEDIPNLVCGYHLYMLRADRSRINPEYLCWALRSNSSRQYFYQMANGSTRFGLNLKHVEESPIAVPPLPEQKKIAEILSGIDTAIEILCARLSKVIESRKVVTGDLLANGIGHTSFCDSEIGRIPTKWELTTGNEVLELGGGVSPSAIQFRHNGDTLYMKVDDFNNPQNSEYIKTTKLSYDIIDNPSAKPYTKGTIVIAKRGAAIEKNRVRIFETETYVDTNLMTIRSTHYLPKFLAAYLRHLNLSNLADMTSIPQINNFHLQRLRLPIPAMSEQAEICMSIDSLSFLEEKYRAKVQKLVLLKSSLSSDLLSGRKRVSV